MESLTLKEKQLREKKDSNAQCILQKEMELTMKQNFLSQEANRYLKARKQIISINLNYLELFYYRIIKSN